MSGRDSSQIEVMKWISLELKTALTRYSSK